MEQNIVYVCLSALVTTIKKAQVKQMNYTDDLFILVKACVEPVTPFGRVDINLYLPRDRVWRKVFFIV